MPAPRNVRSPRRRAPGSGAARTRAASRCCATRRRAGTQSAGTQQRLGHMRCATLSAVLARGAQAWHVMCMHLCVRLHLTCDCINCCLLYQVHAILRTQRPCNTPSRSCDCFVRFAGSHHGPTVCNTQAKNQFHTKLWRRQVGPDTFTLDFQAPMSAMQAFAVCLSAFEHKLACE